MIDFLNHILRILPILSAIAFPVLVAVVTLYIVYRSGSTSIIANKIWGIFIGEKNFFDEKLALKEKVEHDVAKFNFKVNLKTKNLSQIEQFYKFLEKFDLDIDSFKGLRDCYLPSLQKVKKTSKSEMFNISLVVILVGGFLLPIFVGVFIFKDISTFDGGKLANLFIYTFLISASTVLSFSQLLRKIKSINTRKLIYKKKCEYLAKRKPM